MGLDDDFGNQSERKGRGRVCIGDVPLARITRKIRRKKMPRHKNARRYILVVCPTNRVYLLFSRMKGYTLPPPIHIALVHNKANYRRNMMHFLTFSHIFLKSFVSFMS
ncbi:hypothetical protein H0G86_004532 [Trichoderma simmonsii]|uniref:Uncharacterized protein n=1 Tax=Trichoderma simmonsii TaxID=1491479 RepID=A0A8G0LCU8_9HYPO|nr:hypothetical protein H0G86_004532 [Trichoderma simmonsii]